MLDDLVPIKTPSNQLFVNQAERHQSCNSHSCDICECLVQDLFDPNHLFN